MKLKETFAMQDIDQTLFLIPVGSDDFNGIVRSNPTAAFIVNLLKEGTTEEEIIEKMCRKYDAPVERITEDVREILETLRGIHALDE